MSDMQISPQNAPQKVSSRGARISFTKNGWIIRLIGFFLAMAMPYSGIAPFGLSFLAQERKLSLGAIGSFIAVSLGAFAVCSRLGATKYVSAGLIYLAVLFVLERGVRLNDFTAGLVAGMAVFLSGLVLLFWEGFCFFARRLLLWQVRLFLKRAANCSARANSSPKSLEAKKN